MISGRILGITFFAFSMMGGMAACGGGGGDGPRPGCDSDDDCPSGTCGADGRCTSRPDSGPICVDMDGDHRGVGCPMGPDCDDTNITQTGFEVCDMQDNDCDTTIDEGVMSACGGCDPLCRTSGHGPGTPNPFDPEGSGDGVILDEEGNIVLRRREVSEPLHFIWIANTGEGTVSKVDTRTFEEVGRFRTGPLGAANDPSRTSVDSEGNVYVGNRSGYSVSKISAAAGECPDTNGDGMVTTSTDGTTILDWGQDDCVLWNRPLAEGGVIRAVAAQQGFGPDGEIAQYVWVGGYDSSLLWKLDGATGDILIRTSAPVTPYGFALDGFGNLWMASLTNLLGRVDTNRCISEAACTELCGDGAAGDLCVKQTITVPSDTYGITVDRNQRVWLGGNGAKRYDPMAAPGARWTTGPGMFIHGIAADERGNVWGAAMEQGLIRIDSDDPRRYAAVPATVGGSGDFGGGPKGVAVDGDGKVWGINMISEDATVVVPRTAIDEFTVWTEVVPTLVSPYTYSDMTGQQLRLATNLLGAYSSIIDTCPSTPAEHVEYTELRFDATVPDQTLIEWRVRTAETRAALETAAWVALGDVPPTTSPINLAAALSAAGVTPAQFLQVQVSLRSTRGGGTAFATPVVRGYEVVYTCPDLPI